MVRTPDAATQLMQLRQAETVGAVHDNGISAGHINAGFNNCSAQQHIETLVVKIAHHRFQFTLRHLAVRYAYARFRQQLTQLFQHIGNRIHFVVQEINLAAAL